MNAITSLNIGNVGTTQGESGLIRSSQWLQALVTCIGTVAVPSVLSSYLPLTRLELLCHGSRTIFPPLAEPVTLKALHMK
jgi:hypothetical protein